MVPLCNVSLCGAVVRVERCYRKCHHDGAECRAALRGGGSGNLGPCRAAQRRQEMSISLLASQRGTNMYRVPTWIWALCGIFWRRVLCENRHMPACEKYAAACAEASARRCCEAGSKAVARLSCQLSCMNTKGNSLFNIYLGDFEGKSCLKLV